MNALRYSQTAMNDLERIRHFLSEPSTAYAGRIVKELKEAIALLKTYPEMGWQVFTSIHPNLRQVLFHSYRIVYQFQEGVVTVVTISYQTRPPENIPQLKDFKI